MTATEFIGGDRRAGRRGGRSQSTGGNNVSPLFSYQCKNGSIYSGLTRVVWELNEVERGTGWISLGDGTFYITLVQIEERFAARGFHRKGIGLNHLAFPAPSVNAVDDFHAWLMARGVPVLYGSPLDMGHPDQPNYAVFFEDPDRLKLEYVHRPG